MSNAHDSVNINPNGPKKKSWLKRLALGVGVLFLLLVSIIVALPFVIDVDKYRPQAVSMANEHLNGKFAMGKLTLNLWGRIKIQIDGLQVTDSRGRKVLSVKDLYFHVPFSSLLSGSPEFDLKMISPELAIYKNRAGKMNVMGLAKAKSVDVNAPEAASPSSELSAKVPSGKTPAAKVPATELPGMVTRARLGIEMKEAHLLYEDEATHLKSEVKDLDVLIKNLSLSHPIEAEISAVLDTTMGSTFSLKGPAKIKMLIKSEFKGSTFEKAKINATADLDKVAIVVPTIFEKASGQATHASLDMTISGSDEVILHSLKATFFNAEVEGNGGVKNFSAPDIKLSLKSNAVDLKPWSQLLPAMKSYDLAGIASFNAEVWGTAEKPQYKAAAEVKNLTAKAPNLKSQPQINAGVKVATDRVEEIFLSFKAVGNEMVARGRVDSFTKPHITATITSPGMDLDQLIDFPKPQEGKSEAKNTPKSDTPESASSSGSSGSDKATQDFDAALDPLRKNKMARDIVAVLKMDIKSLKAKNVKMTDMVGQATFKDLAFSIDSFRMGLFAGTVKTTAQVQMAPKIPLYHFNGEVNGLDLQAAVASQFDVFKNTLIGKASFKMDGSGSSFNPDSATKNLAAKGNMKVENATFATIDIGKMVAEGIGKSVNALGDKVPALKGANLGTPGNIDSKYSLVSSDFSIAGGKFSAPNFLAKAEPHKGIDLKGDTQVGLIDKSVVAHWEVSDTYNLTKARDLSVEQQGVKVEHILAEGDQPVRFPVEVTGTVLAPKVSYTSVPEALGKVALSNVGKALVAKAKSEAVHQLTNQAPPAIQDALKKFGGGLFGN